MRRPLIAGNWKMYTTASEASNLASEVKAGLEKCGWADIVVFPPYTSISKTAEVLKDSEIEFGGQNLYWEAEGAFTGEISGKMLAETGCKWVIIGHSERRTYFGLKDHDVYRQVDAALKSGLSPVVCIGETLHERESGITEDVLLSQISGGIGSLEDISRLTIAYEPVWAIGTGKTATPEQAQDVHKFIRRIISEKWNTKTADSIRILYGGSVKPGNAGELWAKEDIDGFLIGGASLKADSFIKIAEAVK